MGGCGRSRAVLAPPRTSPTVEPPVAPSPAVPAVDTGAGFVGIVNHSVRDVRHPPLTAPRPLLDRPGGPVRRVLPTGRYCAPVLAEPGGSARPSSAGLAAVRGLSRRARTRRTGRGPAARPGSTAACR